MKNTRRRNSVQTGLRLLVFWGKRSVHNNATRRANANNKAPLRKYTFGEGLCMFLQIHNDQLQFLIPDDHLFLVQGTPFRAFGDFSRDFRMNYRSDLAGSFTFGKLLKWTIFTSSYNKNHINLSGFAALWSQCFFLFENAKK